MTPEAQRLAIAEACGFTSPYHGASAFENKVLRDANDRRVPDYLTDLNAMHEAEKVLTLESGQWRDYEYNLRIVLVISGRKVCNTAEEHRFLHATAAQRAEAFLRCLGLWQSRPTGREDRTL